MSAGKMYADEVDTDVSLVRRLLAAQFPQVDYSSARRVGEHCQDARYAHLRQLEVRAGLDLLGLAIERRWVQDARSGQRVGMVGRQAER
jgi:hypothetical protein